MEYAIKMKSPNEMTELDYARGTQFSDENGYGVWFDSIEEAIEKCKKINGYEVFNSELDSVWENPEYKSEGIKKLSKQLGKILLGYRK